MKIISGVLCTVLAIFLVFLLLVFPNAETLIIEDNANTQIIENTTEASIVENTTEAAIVENTTEAAIIENTTEAAMVENTTEAAIVENTTETAIIENTTGTAIIENITGTEIIENTTETTIIENTTEAAIIENTTDTPIIENNEKTTYVFEDNEKVVTAILSSADIIPNDAEFCVETITQQYNPTQYSQLETLVNDISESQPSDLKSDMEFCAYDIYFLLNGVEIEPSEGSVSVSISYKTPVFEIADNSELKVFHVLDNETDNAILSPVETDTSVTSTGDISSLEFTTESFSVFLVTNGYTMSSSLKYTRIIDSSQTFVNTTYYDSTRALGIAGNFHLVAFDTARLNAHTNGNVLAKNLYAQNNFGTNNLVSELSYIQNYLQVHSSSASSENHVLALGSSASVSLMDNGLSFGVNGLKLDKPKNIYQDDNTGTVPFVDLNYVKSEITSISSLLKSFSNTSNIENHLITSGGSCVESYINLTNVNGVGVYSISATSLNTYPYFGIKGFTSGNTGTVIINVDCSGVSEVTMPVGLIFIDGQAQTTGEVTTFANGKVIWNFVNATGKSITSRQMTGTIIATGATVNLSQNLNGTVIAENINVNAESHRTDFTGKIIDDVSVKKVWKDPNGNIMTGSQISSFSAVVQLYDNGVPLIGTDYTVTLNTSNNWSHTWSVLESSDHSYSVRELSINNGSSDIPVNTSDGISTATGYQIDYNNNAGILLGIITITNTQSNEKIQKVVTKVWEDNNNLDGIRPQNILVQLKSNGVAYGSTISLSSVNSWSYTWTDLLKYNNGTEIVYTVEEIGEVPGYSIQYSADTFTITNTKVVQNLYIKKVSTLSQTEVLIGAEFKIEKLTTEGLVDETFNAITATTNENGLVNFPNLIVGNYRLTEIKAPSGYNLMDVPIIVTVSNVGISVEGSYTVTTDPEGNVVLVIGNTPGIVLPEAGGMGITLFYIIGGGIVIIAVVLLIIYFYKKKTKN